MLQWLTIFSVFLAGFTTPGICLRTSLAERPTPSQTCPAVCEAQPCCCCMVGHEMTPDPHPVPATPPAGSDRLPLLNPDLSPAAAWQLDPPTPRPLAALGDSSRPMGRPGQALQAHLCRWLT
jgi:hypothetical protein